jgi:Right handed beta helix region/Protein of unknown function (DUF1565)
MKIFTLLSVICCSLIFFSSQCFAQSRSAVSFSSTRQNVFEALPDGSQFQRWECVTRFSNTYFVAQHHKSASDSNPGSEQMPFRSIQKAANTAKPGDRILIDEGIYRELVQPMFGGTSASKMISYEAIPGANVVIDGTEEWKIRWEKSTAVEASDSGKENARVWMGLLPKKAFDGINPFSMINMPSNHWGGLITTIENPDYQLRRGLLFVDGKPLNQVLLHKDLWKSPGTYWVEDDGLRVHFRLRENDSPNVHLLEFTARAQAFAPAHPFLGYIRVKGIVFQRVGNGIPGEQRGALSTNCGHHWIIEDNEVNWANTVGIDIGNISFQNLAEAGAGYHIVRRNHVNHCGTTGVCGLVVKWHLLNTVIENNVFENNCWQNTEGLGENAAIKLHMAVNCLISNNIVKNTQYGSGIWMDFDNSNSTIIGNRVSGIQHTLFGGIVFEASLQKNLVEGNYITDVHGAGLSKFEGGGHGFYANYCDSLNIRNNFITNVTGSCICLNSGDPDRMVHGRVVTGRKNDIRKNILSDARVAIILSNTDNYTDENFYGHFTEDGALQIQAPRERLNLEAWRNFFGWDKKGREVSVICDCSAEACDVTLRGAQGEIVRASRLMLNEPFVFRNFISTL